MQPLNTYIDHTFLKSAGPGSAVAQLCSEAREYAFASVCVNPVAVREAAQALSGSGVRVCTVAGFPLGQSTTAVKIAEALGAAADGADEIDFVINQRLLKYAPERCMDELRALSAACRCAPRELTLKLILECCELDDSEKVRGCRMAREAGFDFVKTSTGLGAGGACAHDVRLMRETVGEAMGVKAAGGIRTCEEALAMIAAGANRIGCSASVAIMRAAATMGV